MLTHDPAMYKLLEQQNRLLGRIANALESLEAAWGKDEPEKAKEDKDADA